MQESSPNKKRTGASRGKSASSKSRRRQTSVAAKAESDDLVSSGDSILKRLDQLDGRLTEALTSTAANSVQPIESLTAEVGGQLLDAVVGQGKAISEIARVLEALQGSLSEVSSRPAGSDSIVPSPEDLTSDATQEDFASDLVGSLMAPEVEETQTQNWDDIKQAMLAEAADSEKSATAEQPSPEAAIEEQLDEDLHYDFVAQAEIDKLDKDGLQTLIIDQERIISRLVRRVQQKSRKELQLSPEQLQDVVKDLPDELAVRVETTLKTLDEQARLGELELSLERARISRQLSHLDETREIIEANARALGLEIGPEGRIEAGSGEIRRGGSKSRRWLGALGFGE